jgi:hypothetical protein
MELFLCANNISVKYVLCRIKEISPQKAIVFTDQHNIYQFFDYLKIDNVKVFFIQSSVKWYDLSQLYHLKQEVRQILAKGDDLNHVHMYHQAYGGFYNWIINYCHKLHVPTTYHRTVAPLQMPLAKVSLSSIKAKLIYKLYYSASIKPLDNGRSITPKLSSSFFHDNNIKEAIATEDKETTLGYARQILKKTGIDINKNSLLLLTGCVVDSHLVCLEEYKEKMSLLLNKIQDTQIVCKCHPRFSDEIEDEKKLPHIPSFIPVNILLPFFSVVIGYSSFAILEAFNENVKSISLLDYFMPISTPKRDFYKDYLGNGIIYPKNIEEVLDNLR